MTRPHQHAAVATALLFATACGGAASDPGAGPGPDGDWQLVEGEGPDGEVPLVGDAPVTLTVDGEQLSGTAACNSYSGTAEIEDGRFRARELMHTEMACEPAVIMESEAAYLGTLGQVTAHERDGDELLLTGDDVRLVFTPAAQDG
jgi:heat shock protein HslJ